MCWRRRLTLVVLGHAAKVDGLGASRLYGRASGHALAPIDQVRRCSAEYARFERLAGGRIELDVTVEERRASVSSQQLALIASYLEHFNRRDWAAARALLADDARLEVVGHRVGPFGTHYFTNYAALDWPWRLAFGEVDGQPAIVHFRQQHGAWQPVAFLLISTHAGKISRIRDYVHSEYLLQGTKVTEP